MTLYQLFQYKKSRNFGESTRFKEFQLEKFDFLVETSSGSWLVRLRPSVGSHPITNRGVGGKFKLLLFLLLFKHCFNKNLKKYENKKQYEQINKKVIITVIVLKTQKHVYSDVSFTWAIRSEVSWVTINLGHHILTIVIKHCVNNSKFFVCNKHNHGDNTNVKIDKNFVATVYFIR